MDGNRQGMKISEKKLRNLTEGMHKIWQHVCQHV